MDQPIFSSRRDFLRQMAIGAIGLPLLLESLTHTLSAKGNKTTLIWLRGHSAATHWNSLAGLQEASVFLDEHIRLISMDAAEWENWPIEKMDKDETYLLILEGYFPLSRGNLAQKVIKAHLPRAKVAILLGNEASFAQEANEDMLDLTETLLDADDLPFIRLPGEPASARHFLGLLNHLLLYGFPELDQYRRPMMFFDRRICERCLYQSDFEQGRFLTRFGESHGCLYLLGCKGPVTYNDCPVQKWNASGVWCVEVGSPCTGCTEPEYPRHAGVGMYGRLGAGDAKAPSFLIRHANKLGVATVAVTATGIGLHAVSKQTSSKAMMQTLSPLSDLSE